MSRYSSTFSRWSPWSRIWPFLAVPPQAQYAFIFWASLPMSISLVSMPSMMVTALPNFLVSKRTLIRCCSLLISPQTHMSFGNPHVGQISAMMLGINEMVPTI